MFLGKCILDICRKFAKEHLCLSAILIKVQSRLIEMGVRHGFSPINFLHVLRKLFPKNNFLKKYAQIATGIHFCAGNSFVRSTNVASVTSVACSLNHVVA